MSDHDIESAMLAELSQDVSPTPTGETDAIPEQPQPPKAPVVEKKRSAPREILLPPASPKPANSPTSSTAGTAGKAPDEDSKDLLGICRVDVGKVWATPSDELERRKDRPVVHGLFRRGSVGLLGAPSKANKSWLMGHLAVAVGSGLPWIGFRTERGPVTIFDFELKPSTLLHRLRCIGEGFEAEGETTVPPETFAFRGHDPKQALEATLTAIAKMPAGAVAIVDCLQALGIEDHNDPAEIRSIWNRFQSAAGISGAFVVIVDHFNKSTEAKGVNRISGTMAKAAAPDAIITLHPDGQAVRMEFVLRDDPPIPDLFLRFSLLGHRFEPIDPGEHAKLRELQQADAKIAKLTPSLVGLPDGWFKVADAAEVWKIGPRAALKRAEAMARLELLGSMKQGQAWLFRINRNSPISSDSSDEP